MLYSFLYAVSVPTLKANASEERKKGKSIWKKHEEASSSLITEEMMATPIDRRIDLVQGFDLNDITVNEMISRHCHKLSISRLCRFFGVQAKT